MRRSLGLPALVLIAACHPGAPPQAAAPVIPDHGVIGVAAAQLEPGFWIRQAPRPRDVVLTPDAIARQNRDMLDRDSSLIDLERLPATLTRERVARWVTGLSRLPTRQIYKETGDSVSAAELADLAAATQPDRIPAEQPLRWALITRRADMRTFPTRMRVFSSRGNTDIDRWQETGIFPGTPVVIVHESRDGAWWFVLSQHYAAWIEKAYVAEGPRELVLGYGRKTPFLVVTGATVRTVFTPEQPSVSELQLDMGVRVPLRAPPDWPANQPVNGQHPYTSYVIELPTRGADGRLAITPALLSRGADVASDYLPLTAENVLRQAFKFLGERYGWGHGYNGRDCSGFVSEVYRSFGVDLPRNTGDQARSPALHGTAFTSADARERRLGVVREAQVGDMVFIPGHVVMVIGHWRGLTYIIHDVTGVSYVGTDGSVTRVPLNEVSVTPLEPLASGAEAAWVDRITGIQRVRP